MSIDSSSTGGESPFGVGRRFTPLGAMIRGVLAGAVGTLAMDLLWYVRYRRGGGTTAFPAWEFGGVSSWDEASMPGQVGRRLLAAWLQGDPPDSWAGSTQNAFHWGYGTSWGALYGLLVGSLRDPRGIYGPPFGLAVWLNDYIILPLGKFYKPIWEYDAKTLEEDASAHLLYGAVTGLVFRLLAGGPSGRSANSPR